VISRAVVFGALGLVAASLFGCAEVVIRQTGFPPVQVQAALPAPPPEKPVEKIQITDKVQFEFGKANLKPASFPVLDQIVKVMTDRPGIKLVQIEGHTDATGDADRNRVLSQKRAESVLEYLVKRGIARARLAAKGFGPDKPIATNDTEQGREANRRVEFSILEQEGR